MSRVIYTAIIGEGWDELKEPTCPSPGWRFVCFTDQPLTSPTWEIIQVPASEDPRRLARDIKIRPHVWLSDAEHTMWLDASFQINVDINDIWRQFVAPFTCPSHPVRNNLMSEVGSCIVNKRGEPGLVHAQGEAYRAEGIDGFGALITSGMLLRDNSPECVALCEAWWAEVCAWSTRDQIAFCKASIGHKFTTFKWDYSQSKQIIYKKHIPHRH